MAQRLNNEEAREWNKAQADLIRSVADRIEAGEYYSLTVDNGSLFGLGLPRPSMPKQRRLTVQVEYIEQEKADG